VHTLALAGPTVEPHNPSWLATGPHIVAGTYVARGHGRLDVDTCDDLTAALVRSGSPSRTLPEGLCTECEDEEGHDETSEEPLREDVKESH